jgi:putative Holliday junction resolvase
MFRALGVDLGRRRIGLAVSDATGTLARPLATINLDAAGTANAGGPAGVAQVAREVARLAAEDDGLCVVVVGVPSSLDGTPTKQTRQVALFMEALRSCISVPIVGEDERLTSREAEQRLALRERDWRKRKLRLDAAAAAIMLQDYLDRSASPAKTDRAWEASEASEAWED